MIHFHKIVFFIVAVLMLIIAACSDKTEIVDPPPAYTPTPYELEIPYAFPTKLTHLAANPTKIIAYQ